MGDVRTVCFVGHSGAGKTALTEALLQSHGAGGQLDASPEAKERGSSIDLNVATVEVGQDLLNILDAPGFNEFIEETYKGLHVAETAALVVNAERGVEVTTEVAWDLIERYEKPALALVNRMDAENADFDQAVGVLQETFGDRLAPIHWPILDDGQFAGVVDLIHEQARYFDGKTGDVPDELADAVQSGRESLLEALSEVDDDLMEHFLEDQDIPNDEVEGALKTAITQRSLVPIVPTSTQIPGSLKLLTELIVEETPSFHETYDPEDEFVGLVFNAHSDQYIGAMAFLKVYGGSLKEGVKMTNVRTGATENVREILRASGDKPVPISEAKSGEVAVLTKLEDFELNDTFASTEREPMSLGELPTPVYPRAVEPLSESDEEKMSAALRQLIQTKATLSLTRDDVTHETILSGMGDTQLGVFVQRLKNRYGTGVELKRPLVPYKETITAQAEGSHRHKKQTGGRGQFGEVYLRIEPLERGTGFEFVDEIKGGVIPNQFIPACEKGIVEAMEKGQFGYPMTDVRAAVYDGSYHSVDSSEAAFKIAASQAFQTAVGNDNPVLLEPVMKLDIRAPSAYTGDIMSNLSGKRGRVLGMEPEETGTEHIEAEVPLAEVQDYALELKSITQGRALFKVTFDHYQPVASPQLAEELLGRERRDGGGE